MIWCSMFIQLCGKQIKGVQTNFEDHLALFKASQFRTSLNSRVSFETSFDSKQPKLEPKLVSALSETKRLFRLFRFYTKPQSFDVSIEPKQTEDQPKQFDREHILQFFYGSQLLEWQICC